MPNMIALSHECAKILHPGALPLALGIWSISKNLPFHYIYLHCKIWSL